MTLWLLPRSPIKGVQGAAQAISGKRIRPQSYGVPMVQAERCPAANGPRTTVA